MNKILAVYSNGGTPTAHEVHDVTPEGARIETDDRWYAGTMVTISLQQHPADEDLSRCDDVSQLSQHAKAVIRMRARVVGQEDDGVRVKFVYVNKHERRQFEQFLSSPNAVAGQRFTWLRRGASGQSLVEFVLSFPLLLLLFANVVNFGGFFYAAITVANAARNGSQYLVLGGASLGMPTPPSAAQVHQLIIEDTVTLINPSNLTVRTCKEDKANPGAILCDTFGSGTFTDPVLDARAEAPLYVMAWVDVQYDYVPYIPIFDVPVVGIPLTTPPTTLNSQSLMRMLQ